MITILEKLTQSDLNIVLIVASTVIFAMIVLFSIAISGDRDYKRKMNKAINPLRVFVINVDKQWVTYFDLTNLKKKRTVDLDYFYSTFPESAKVEEWVKSLSESEDVPDILETPIYIREKGKPIQSLLKFKNVNNNRRILHITSFLLKTAEENDILMEKKRIISSKKFVIKELNKTRLRLPGFTLAFYFQYADKYKSLNEIDPVIFGYLKNFFFEYLDENRYLVEENNNCLVLVDKESKQAVFTANTIRDSVISRFDKYLSLNGLENEIETYVGGVINKDLRRNREDIISEAVNMAKSSMFDNNSSTILWRKRGKSTVASLDETSYRSEVSKIISDRKIRTKYRLIFDVSKMSTYGYLLDIIFNDQQFSTVDELREYAVRSGDSKNLLSYLAKEGLPRFISQKSSSTTKLLFPVLMEEKGLLVSTFASLPRANEANIVFLFSEQDILNRLGSVTENDVYDDMKAIKAKGYEAGIVVTAEGLRLSPKVYSQFDVFVADLNQNSDKFSVERMLRSTLHSVVEKLIKYKKPIICNGIESWDAIELLVRSGLTHICGESLSPSSDMLLQIDLRSEKKINNMKG